MRRIETFTRNLCWIDVFETRRFGGKMHRLFGPRDVGELIAGSMITGPAARVQLFASIAGKPVEVQIGPNRIVPDLQLVLRGAALQSAKIGCGRRQAAAEAAEETAPGSKAAERLADAEGRASNAERAGESSRPAGAKAARRRRKRLS